MQNNLFYNKRLKNYARKNRNSGTKAEVLLWMHVLKASRTGYKFKRQRPILNYIADFMCTELKLIIEVDGYSHLLEVTKQKDKVRQKALEDHGFVVIRFSDGDVLQNMDWVKDRIMEKIEELKG